MEHDAEGEVEQDVDAVYEDYSGSSMEDADADEYDAEGGSTETQ